jgi:hypothetical protein
MIKIGQKVQASTHVMLSAIFYWGPKVTSLVAYGRCAQHFAWCWLYAGYMSHIVQGWSRHHAPTAAISLKTECRAGHGTTRLPAISLKTECRAGHGTCTRLPAISLKTECRAGHGTTRLPAISLKTDIVDFLGKEIKMHRVGVMGYNFLHFFEKALSWYTIHLKFGRDYKCIAYKGRAYTSAGHVNGVRS